MTTRKVQHQDNSNPAFAALNPQKRRELASEGGHVENEEDQYSEIDSQGARSGKLPQGTDKAAAFNPQEATAAGRVGGQSIQAGNRRGQNMAALGKDDSPHQDHGKNR